MLDNVLVIIVVNTSMSTISMQESPHDLIKLYLVLNIPIEDFGFLETMLASKLFLQI